MTDAIMRAVEDCKEKPSRSEMVRRIVAEWLQSKGYMKN